MEDLREQTRRRTRDGLRRHLQTFDLDPTFSVGVWYFFPGGGRFHEAYIDPEPVTEALALLAELHDEGVVDGSLGVEAHYPNEINDDLLDAYRRLEADTGIRVITVIPNLFYERRFEFGSLSNPDDAVRRVAIERTTAALALNRALGTEFQVVWPGSDGYENPIGTAFYAMWDRFEAGLAEAMDAEPGVRVAIEPKPYEPRGNNIYRNTANGLLLARNVEALLRAGANRALLREGRCLVGLNPEVGHVLMGHEELAYAFASILREGRLAHTHWNSQPLGNYDQDQNVGMLGLDQQYAALLVLKLYGYRGRFGIDINPERMPVRTALINTMNSLRSACTLVNNLDYDRLVDAMYAPAAHRGVAEDVMLRALAPATARLLPFGE
jgi:xylose isomerase